MQAASAMADAAQCAAEELLLQPSFCDALKAVEAALAARHEQQEPKLQVLPKEHADIVAQVAAEIAAQRRQQQEVRAGVGLRSTGGLCVAGWMAGAVLRVM